MFHILVVEDDQALNKLICRVLEKNGYEATAVFDGEEALAMLDKTYIDLIITDLMMPHMDGYDLTKELRENGYQLPILVVTAKDTFPDKLKGFKLGIDDYMVKPFSPAELVARVRSLIMIHQRLLERKEGRKPTQLLMGNLKILPEERRVFLGEEEIALANKEFELLLLMAQNPNIAFSKETLFNRIWGMDSVGATDTVTVHINRLRQKLERNSASPRMIETVWGVGYRFKINV